MIKPLNLAALLSGAAIAALFAAAAAVADEVVLENGDAITGKVKRLEDGVLTVTTDYSKPLGIRASSVAGITTDEPVEVRLAGGEVVKGRLSSPVAGKVVLEPGEGRSAVEVDWARVESVNPKKAAWNGSVSIGGNLQTGNTDRMSVAASAEAVRKSDIDRTNFKLLYNYAEEADSMTVRNLYGALKYDYFFTGRTYGFVSVEMLSDRFRDIRLRTVTGPGVGYQVWDEKTRALSLEIGAAYFAEDLVTGLDDSWATSRAAFSLRWRLNGSLEFTDAFVLSNRVDDMADYQMRNEAAVTTGLGASWALKLSNIMDYDSEPSAGVRSTDIFWILALQYAF